jgi:hypothetical protein
MDRCIAKITSSVIFSALILTPAPAQNIPSGPAAPTTLTIDRDLWTNMATAIAGLSMPLATHQQIQQIMREIEREATTRALRNRPPSPAPQ